MFVKCIFGEKSVNENKNHQTVPNFSLFYYPLFLIFHYVQNIEQTNIEKLRENTTRATIRKRMLQEAKKNITR